MISKLFCVFALLLASLPAFAQANKEPNFGGVERFVEVEGVRVRYMVRLPDGETDPQKVRPVIIGLHGVVGCSEHIMWSMRKVASNLGALLIAPQGTKAAEQEGYNRWDSVRDPLHYGAVLEDAARNYGVDRSRVTLIGFSHGGRMALRALSRFPERYNMVGLLATTWPTDYEEAGLKRAIERGVPIFYGNGQLDKSMGKEFAISHARLLAMGFTVMSVNPPDVAHDAPPLMDFFESAYRQLARPLESRADLPKVNP